MIEPTPFYALALQVACRAVNRQPDAGGAQARMAGTLERLERQIAASKAFIGADLRLVVLPEYFLTGFPMGESVAAWADKAAIAMDGPELESLGRCAERLGVFVAGNAYELDANFPGLYFQTSFVVDDGGQVVLRYRRLNSMFAPTPHDVWSRYLDLYGYEAVFPVADTVLGRLAAIASEEILYPEVARCLAVRGAEVLLHCTSEPYGDGDTPKEVCKRARAIENLAYVVSANSGGILDTDIPASSADGGSKLIDYQGRVLARAGTGESMAAFAELDPAALRRHRRRPGMMNLLARQRFELYADTYAGRSFHPPNTMAGGEVERGQFRRTQAEVIARLAADGVI